MEITARRPHCKSEIALAGGLLMRGLLGQAGHDRHAGRSDLLSFMFHWRICAVLGPFWLQASESPTWGDGDGETGNISKPETRGGARPGLSATLGVSVLSPKSQADRTVLGVVPSNDSVQGQGDTVSSHGALPGIP